MYDFVRGLSPYPAAWTELVSPEGKVDVMKVYRTEKIFKEHSLPFGQVDTDGRTYLQVALKDGFLRLHEIQLAGKKRMGVVDFLRGSKINSNYQVR